MFLSSWEGEGIFHMGVLAPAFGETRGGQSPLPAPAVFQVSLAQNLPYAKVASVGVAYAATLHIFTG